MIVNERTSYANATYLANYSKSTYAPQYTTSAEVTRKNSALYVNANFHDSASMLLLTLANANYYCANTNIMFQFDMLLVTLSNH